MKRIWWGHQPNEMANDDEDVLLGLYSGSTLLPFHRRRPRVSGCRRKEEGVPRKGNSHSILPFVAFWRLFKFKGTTALNWPTRNLWADRLSVSLSNNSPDGRAGGELNNLQIRAKLSHWYFEGHPPLSPPPSPLPLLRGLLKRVIDTRAG